MASLTKDNRLLFNAGDGKRKSIRLGKLPKKQAQGIQRHVERLIACRIDGSAPPEETSRWVVGVSEKLRGKLVRAGLLQPKATTDGYTLGELVADYVDRPKWHGFKPGTQKNNLRTFGYLLDYFDVTQAVRGITAAMAMDWYDHLLLKKNKGGRGLVVASCNTSAAIAHSLFNYAIDAESLDRNPFKKLPRSARKGDNATVSTADSLLVLDAMVGSQHRLMFGLSRWGGLRMPSEAKVLRWCDIDWERDRFLVHAPKTERHEGHETRWVPIFPELAQLLDKRFTEAAEGDEYVLPELQHHCGSYAGEVLKRAIKRAGLEKWKRVWHSMRATRQTELEAIVGNRDMVCGWMGNSPQVAGKHYVNYTDQQFADAAQRVAQKATQHMAAKGGTDVQTENHEALKCP